MGLSIINPKLYFTYDKQVFEMINIIFAYVNWTSHVFSLKLDCEPSMLVIENFSLRVSVSWKIKGKFKLYQTHHMRKDKSM